MNEWLVLFLVFVVFIVSWLLAYLTLRLLVDGIGNWQERRQRAKSRPYHRQLGL